MSYPFHVGKIFVFDSNLAGNHGAGAALEAKVRYGAKQGQGVGPAGWSYAIPTKDQKINNLPLNIIRQFVYGFLEYAHSRRELDFYVTPIGTGLAGYTHREIAPFFSQFAVAGITNCEFPSEWKEWL